MLLLLSKSFSLVSQSIPLLTHPINEATPISIKGQYLLSPCTFDFSRREKSTVGIRTTLNLPCALQKPNPVVLICVPNDYVVKGQINWKQSFIENLVRKLIVTPDPQSPTANAISNSPESKKNTSKEFFLPAIGRSIKRKASTIAGISPQTTRKQSLRFLLPDCQFRTLGRMLRCPKQIKLRAAQQRLRQMVVFLTSPQNSLMIDIFPSPLKQSVCHSFNPLIYS